MTSNEWWPRYVRGVGLSETELLRRNAMPMPLLRDFQLGWDAAIVQRDKLVEDVRVLRSRLQEALDTQISPEEAGIGYVIIRNELDAILAAHDSPAETPAQGGEHDDKEGNPL